MWKYFSEYYFTNLIVIFQTMTLVVLGIKYYNLIKGLRIFLVYSFFSGAQCLVGAIINTYKPLDLYQSPFLEVSVNFFIVFEFIVFYTFLIKVLRNGTAKLLLKLAGSFFILLTLYFWVFLKALYFFPENLNLVESLLILIPCLYYYFELLKHSATRPLHQDPVFWIITGIFFLFATITPLFLLRKSVDQYFHYLYRSIYSINFFSYIILYISLKICMTSICSLSYSFLFMSSNLSLSI